MMLTTCSPQVLDRRTANTKLPRTHAGAWISTIVGLGFAYINGRIATAVRSGSAVWSGSWQGSGTWATAIGAVATVAIVLIAASPDSRPIAPSSHAPAHAGTATLGW